MSRSSPSTPKQRPKKAERCKMKTYGGFFIMAGPAPRGVKPAQCKEAALANGFCERHNPENW